MNVSGILNVFVKQTEKGKLFSGSISKKDINGNYQSARVNVRFVGDKFSESKLEKFTPEYCYCIEVVSGFLSFTKKESAVYWELVVTDAKCPKKYKIENANPSEVLF